MRVRDATALVACAATLKPFLYHPERGQDRNLPTIVHVQRNQYSCSFHNVSIGPQVSYLDYSLMHAVTFRHSSVLVGERRHPNLPYSIIVVCSRFSLETRNTATYLSVEFCLAKLDRPKLNVTVYIVDSQTGPTLKKKAQWYHKHKDTALDVLYHKHKDTALESCVHVTWRATG